MEGMFRQLEIYSPVGQLYQPQDSKQLMFYKEDEHGQILEEGITEAGSISSFIAAGTSYSTHAVQMVPFYAYYSMFGYQRVGDLVWAAGGRRRPGRSRKTTDAISTKRSCAGEIAPFGPSPPKGSQPRSLSSHAPPAQALMPDSFPSTYAKSRRSGWHSSSPLSCS
jgi:hypothetical protein